MTLSNPRIFSSRFAIQMGGACFVTSFICLSLEFGGGNIFAGLLLAAGYLLFYAVPLLIVAFIVGFIAFLAGRLVGTTVTAMAVSSLMLVTVIPTYIDSQPMARLRKLVWKEAPESLSVRFHEIQTSFNDGDTHAFIIESDSQTITQLCRAASLSEIPDRSPRRTLSYLPSHFSPQPAFKSDTVYYRGAHIELAHTPSEARAFLVWSYGITKPSAK